MSSYLVVTDGRELSFLNVKLMVASNGTMFLKDNSSGKTVFASSATNVTIMEI